ncbi:extracellular superoxide dismutase [Cu-Zn] [Rhinophrynus dorsalis]
MCHLVYLATIVFISTFCSVKAEVGKTCEDETLTDIHNKVKDLWMNLLNAMPIQTDSNKTAYATCQLKPSPKLEATEIKVTGEVVFKQVYPNGKLEAIFAIDGFPIDANQSARAIHIHNFGDLSDGCDSAGGHYNPLHVNHPNHPGDFGNFRVKDGKIQRHLTNLEATIFGPFSAIGRAVVVHMQADDLGKGNNQASLENGNAGKRLACCVIGVSSKNNWEKYFQESAALKSPRVSRRTNVKQKKINKY